MKNIEKINNVSFLYRIEENIYYTSFPKLELFLLNKKSKLVFNFFECHFIEKWGDGILLNENYFFSGIESRFLFEKSPNTYKQLIINEDTLMIKVIDYEKEVVSNAIFKKSTSIISFYKTINNINAKVYIPNNKFLSLHSSTLTCHSLSDGSEIWRYEFTGGNEGALHIHIVDADAQRVIAHSDFGTVCINSNTGKQIWYRSDAAMYKKKGKYAILGGDKEGGVTYLEYYAETGTTIRQVQLTDTFEKNRFYSPSSQSFEIWDDNYIVCYQSTFRSSVVLVNLTTAAIEWEYFFEDDNGERIDLATDCIQIQGNRLYVLDMQHTLHVFEKEPTAYYQETL